MDGNPLTILPQLQQLLTQSADRSADLLAQQAQAVTQQAAMTAAVEHLASALDRLVAALQPPATPTDGRTHGSDLASRTA